MTRRRPFPCAHCGALVPARAVACPECGSDAATGWSEQASDFAGDLPTGYDDDPDFDYEETLRSEGLAEGGPPSRAAVRRRWVVVVIVVLIACIVLWLAEH